MRTLTRRQWIGAAAAVGIAGLGVDAFGIEPSHLTVTRHRLDGGTGPTIRIVQLSDLHLELVKRTEERIAETVAQLSPDLILLTGDMIDRAANVGLVRDFLDLLERRTPKLAILGNWEHWTKIDIGQLARTYEQFNCQLLRNESVTLHFGAHALLVTGLDDFVGGTPDFVVAVQQAQWNPNHLLLAHCPIQRDALQTRGQSLDSLSGFRQSQHAIDPRLFRPQYMLSGHTHGGQIAPFGFAPLCPPGSGRYVQGWYRDGDIGLYVSRGIGTSLIPARLGSPPEIAYFEWSLA